MKIIKHFRLQNYLLTFVGFIKNKKDKIIFKALNFYKS